MFYKGFVAMADLRLPWLGKSEEELIENARFFTSYFYLSLVITD